ncbi:LAFA_0A01640g1_1 [Lachancea sp. 'fantastica']|nr:LAFA_0A01640g1_1 [Lachancea sp. 'fantastica']
MLDLSPILGKHVTFPLMCCFLYLIYKDLAASDRKIKEGHSGNQHQQQQQQQQRQDPNNDWKSNIILTDKVSATDKSWDQTKPFPYQPFKAGEYKLNMGIKTIPTQDWLVLDNTYRSRIEAKWQVVRENYQDVIFYLDPAMVNTTATQEQSENEGDPLYEETAITSQDVKNCEIALCELYENIVVFLLQRYPQHFQVSQPPSQDSPGVLHNQILDEHHPVDPRKYLDLAETRVKTFSYRCTDAEVMPSDTFVANNNNNKNNNNNNNNNTTKSDSVGYRCLISCTRTQRAHELILALSRLVEEDLILLFPNDKRQFNREYVLMAGIFAFAAGFNPRERFLKPLTLLHGPVPEYRKKLQMHMNRFFETHNIGKLVMRLNFSFQTHSRMYVTNDNKGLATEQISAKTLEQLRGGRDLYYRSERQCLIKLGPQSQAMCFSIKTYLWNMADQFLTDDFYSQNGVLQDMYDAVDGMQENVGQYKRKPEWGPALLELVRNKIYSQKNQTN